VRTGARCSGPVHRPDALGGERGEGYSCGPREITVASGYRPASRSQAQDRPVQLAGGPSCHFGKGAYASAGPATRLPDVLLLSLDLADGRVLPVPEPAGRMARSSILSGNLQKGAV
jgi:hypothetical protein